MSMINYVYYICKSFLQLRQHVPTTFSYNMDILNRRYIKQYLKHKMPCRSHAMDYFLSAVHVSQIPPTA